MARKNIPFAFVFDYLAPLEISVKPMFGLWAIYVQEKIVLILRQRKDHPEINGIWVATYPEHHQGLKHELPALCSVSTYSDDIKNTEWQLLRADADNFESSAIKVCELISNNDQRIGRIPKPGKAKK